MKNIFNIGLCLSLSACASAAAYDSNTAAVAETTGREVQSVNNDVRPAIAQAVKSVNVSEIEADKCPHYKYEDFGTIDKMLRDGIYYNKTDDIRAALKRGADIESVVCSSYSILPRAGLDTLKMLTDNGYSFKDQCANIALLRGKTEESLVRLNYLISQGADVNCTSSGKYSLLKSYLLMNVDFSGMRGSRVGELKNQPFTDMDKRLLVRLLDAGANKDINTYLDSHETQSGRVRRDAVWSTSGTPGPRFMPIIKILIEYGLDVNGRQHKIHDESNGEFLFTNGTNLMFHAIYETKYTLEERKELLLYFVNELGFDINARFNRAFEPNKRKNNRNLITSWKTRFGKRGRDFELFIFDNGGEYLN